MRKKIAIYLDYSFRIPNFIKTFDDFKAYLFADNLDGFEIEQLNFWKKELQNEEIEKFYSTKTIKETEDIKIKDWEKYFYNQDHYLRFLEEYSYNLFVDCDVPCKRDIEYFNTAQKYLFDIAIIDEYVSSRKKLNTFFYLSKIKLLPQQVIFLKQGEELEGDFYKIWNPLKNSEQYNQEGEGEFEIWLKEIEQELTTK